MKKKIIEFIKKYSLISPGNTIIAAVSGGPDSIAMLHVIREIALEWGVWIRAAHFNHMFRGKESDEEAFFTALTARQMGLECTVESHNVPLYLKETGMSPEEGARALRYNFLQREAEKINADFIMTAHHANDQAETVLLHLLRGTGPEGLAAIAPKEGNLIRPMLNVTKEEILSYCWVNNLEYRLDPSNDKGIYTRNRVRLNLIPFLSQFNPQIVHSLVKTADICREENDFLNQITQSAQAKLTIVSEKQRVGINYLEIRSFHPAVQRRLIRKVLDDFTGMQGYLSFDHTEEILRLKPGKEMCLSGPVYVRCEREMWVFSKEKPAKNKYNPIPPVCLQVPGIACVPALNIKVEAEIVDHPGDANQHESYVRCFNTSILNGGISIRNRRPGDRFRPEGMKGSKKLKDFIIDIKIPQAERDRIPLVLSGEEIIWVVGYRTAQGKGVSPQDEKAVEIKVEKMFRE